MSASLSLAALGRLPAGVRPRYDPNATRVGIVHLGIGNFHRAHQAVYADDALAAGESGWAICAINLRSHAIVDCLLRQNGLYTLLIRNADTTARVIGALREAIPYSAEPDRATERLADPAVRIVTLTITEKGYAEQPGGAIALLADGIVRRIQTGAGAFTLLSCDNLSLNGDALYRALREEARRRGDGRLHAFIEDSITCPNTMVDRIVPATSSADREEALALTGFQDECPVPSEGFSQWVIEDRFAAGRPDWARHGVQFVREVAPFEAMKLRLLNAAHSALAYLGVPAGFVTVDEAIGEPVLRAFVERMWREDLLPTLPASVRSLAPDYCAALLSRFSNPALGHRLSQIAIDGSQKIPMRWLPAARERLAAGVVPDALALALAAWLRFLGGKGEGGEHWSIEDPLAQLLAQRLADAPDAPDAPDARVDALLGFELVFGDLAGNAVLRERVVHWHRRLMMQGTRRALR